MRLNAALTSPLARHNTGSCRHVTLGLISQGKGLNRGTWMGGGAGCQAGAKETKAPPSSRFISDSKETVSREFAYCFKA
jgi:hypothetical protein